MWQAAAEQEGHGVKRVIVTVAIFLLAGAVVNVGVAWGLAGLASPTTVGDALLPRASVISIARHSTLPCDTKPFQVSSLLC